mgnify:CR=1 FL=1
MKIKDRIREFRRVPASTLLPHPRNWRQHPPAQLDALRGILSEIGWADAALVRETPDGLQLIDGHARTEVAPDAEIPVLVVDVSDEEAEKLLATHDPLAAMAEANQSALNDLIAGITTNSEALQQRLDDLRFDGEAFDVESIEFPELPDGDKTGYCTMSFSVTTDQREVIQEAIRAAKDAGPFVSDNPNANGNALARIAEAYVGQC